VRSILALFCLVVPCWISLASAADPIFPDGAKLEMLWNDGEFTEGVAARQDGQIFFSDIAIEGPGPGRILQFDPATKQTTVFVKDSGQSNGLFFAPDGRMLAACGAKVGHRSLSEFDAEGQVKHLAQRFQGKLFNAPNDLVVHPRGWVYFTDPRYVGSEPLELDHQSVYRYDPDGSLHRVTSNITKPNGVIISPDGKRLYVAETDNGTTGVEPPNTPPQPKRFTLNVFPIRDDGSLGDKQMLVDYGDDLGIDGMAIDTTGRIYAAIRHSVRHGIAVYSPEGKELAFLQMDRLPTNCTFGRGKESQVLYVTADKGLFRIKVNAEGYHP
jgi:gluconolactonase